MKIIYFVNDLFGKDGGSVNALNTIEPAIKAGHECLVLVNTINKNKKINQKAIMRKTLTYLNNPLLIVVDFWKILIIIKRNKPDVIHFLTEPFAPFLPLIALFVKCRYILTVCGTYAIVPYRRLRTRLLALWYYRRVDAIIAISDYTASRLCAILPKTQIKTSVIPCGISLETYNFSLPMPKSKQSLVSIVFIGWVKERKGILESLQALYEYKKKHGANFIFSIIGRYDTSEKYWQSLNSYIDKAGLKENIEFCGILDEDAKQERLKNANLFIMLSQVHGDYFEGFGLVYLEANAYGIPVIGPNDSGTTQAIKDGFSGYLVEASKSQEVAKKIYQVVDERRINPENCMRWAREHDRERIIVKILEKYQF